MSRLGRMIPVAAALASMVVPDLGASHGLRGCSYSANERKQINRRRLRERLARTSRRKNRAIARSKGRKVR
jgi:hypothetical protein